MKLVIIDASVVAYQIVSVLEKHYGVDCSANIDAQIYTESAINWVNQNGWLPALHEQRVKVLWALDSKPYWRSFLYPDYKGNRSQKPECFKMVIKKLFEANISRLEFPGYEADDIAAAIVRMWLASSNNLISQFFLGTVDSDWCGLVLNPNIFWCNTRLHEPRLRSRTEVYNWLCSKWTKQSKKKQKLWDLPSFTEFDCSDIWAWKVATGDKADNLDPDSAKHLIDLLHPPRMYDLTDQPEAVQRIHKAIHSASFTSSAEARKHHSVMLALGLMPPIDTLLIPADLANRQLVA